ncbi:MAG: hypothetical protein IPH08_11825 [Rhodocyclaceae bacterium]|nr:hypothetical protein [Rhodocyclaceae bacterium]
MPNRLSLAVIVGLLMQLFSSPAIASNGAGGGAECGSPTIEKEAANGTPDSLKAALSKALENTMTWMQKNRVWVKGTDFEFWDIQSVKNSTNEERIGMYAKWLKGCNGNALLSAAVVTGNKENVDYLLSVGISPNAGTDEGIFMKCLPVVAQIAVTTAVHRALHHQEIKSKLCASESQRFLTA